MINGIRMTQYFFDVTDLRNYLTFHTQVSGIQRVSISTIARAREAIGPEQVWLSYYDPISNKYLACQCPKDLGINFLDPSDLSKVLDARLNLRTLPGMAQHRNSQARLQSRVILWDIRARLGETRYFKRYGTNRKAWLEARAEYKAKQIEWKKDTVKIYRANFQDVAKNGDHLVLLDNAWQPAGLDHWLSKASHQIGLSVTVLLHDLIPLVRPQYTTSSICKKFHVWLRKSTKYVTKYIANSQNTASDLHEFLKSVNASQPVSVVPLAQAQLPKTQPVCTVQTGEPSSYAGFEQHLDLPDEIRVLVKTPYVLVVGTMEVRKNLWQLATVWDRLRKQPGRILPKLVFAGRRGWLNDDFDILMSATGQLGGWVEIIEEPDDAVLDYLYRHCLFTMTTSFYEGWGLPIGESLSYVKTAVVSHTSSMPEVGADMVEYCDPHDMNSIEAACIRLIDDEEYRELLEARISVAHLRTWDDVAHDMLNVVLKT